MVVETSAPSLKVTVLMVLNHAVRFGAEMECNSIQRASETFPPSDNQDKIS
jgi:hypothetical protein